MNAVIITRANAKEIAALVLAVQERQKAIPTRELPESERESLIRQYERRLARLKSGMSLGKVIHGKIQRSECLNLAKLFHVSIDTVLRDHDILAAQAKQIGVELKFSNKQPPSGGEGGDHERRWTDDNQTI